MKRLVSILLVSLSISTFASTASAKTPQEVFTSYTDFKNSFYLEDYQTAAEHAYIAWQKAEELIGDSSETYILARNFANLNANAELQQDHVIEAYFRSIELAKTKEEKASLVAALREYSKKIDDKKLKRKVAKLRKKFGKPPTSINSPTSKNSRPNLPKSANGFFWSRVNPSPVFAPVVTTLN